VGYDHDIIYDFSKKDYLVNPLDGKSIFNNLILNEPTTIDNILNNIKNLLNKIRVYTNVEILRDAIVLDNQYTHNNKIVLMKNRKEIFFLKNSLVKVLEKSKNIKNFFDLSEILFKYSPNNIFEFYLNITLDFTGRVYELSHFSQSRSKVTRWLIYSTNSPFTSFLKNLPGKDRFNPDFLAPIDLLKKNPRLLLLVDSYINSVGDLTNSIENIKNFLRKIEDVEHSYIFLPNCFFTMEDIRSISLLNIIISLSFAFFKKSNYLHDVSVDEIMIFVILKFESIKFNNYDEMYAFLINDFEDRSYYGNVKDFFCNIKDNSPIKLNLSRDSRTQALVLISLLCVLKPQHNKLYKKFNIIRSDKLYDPYISLLVDLVKEMVILSKAIKFKEFNMSEVRIIVAKYTIPRSLIKLLIMKRLYICTYHSWYIDLISSSFYKEILLKSDDKDASKRELGILLNIYYHYLDTFLKDYFEINILDIKLKKVKGSYSNSPTPIFRSSEDHFINYFDYFLKKPTVFVNTNTDISTNDHEKNIIIQLMFLMKDFFKKHKDVLLKDSNILIKNNLENLLKKRLVVVSNTYSTNFDFET
jgi:hypothetical protein